MKKLMLCGMMAAWSAFVACGQRCDWMAELSDTVRIESLCVPGAHDAATGEGFRWPFVSRFGRTQSMGLREQWAQGVRAFDLRPALRNGELVICHGPLPTRLTLKEALKVISSLLEEHPTEVAFVLLRREDGRPWDEDTCESSALPERLGDARGRMIVLRRDQMSGWHHTGQLRQGKIGAKALWVEDLFDCSEPGRISQKLSLLRDVMRQDGLVVVHTSGYFRPASAESNREMAEIGAGYVLDLLSRGEAVKGLMMMDFIGEGLNRALVDRLINQK